MSFQRIGLPVGSGISGSITGQLSGIKHIILIGAILMASAFQVRAASPADCSAKPEQGAWVKVKMIPPPSLPSGKGEAGHFSALGCGIVYGCRAKETMVTDARCKVVFTADRTVHGTCLWNGHGEPGDCNSCVATPPSASDCKWHLEKK